MKVSSVLSIIVFCLTTNIFSQVQFTPHTIAFVSDSRSVFAIDVDDDGDMDVLSASGGGGGGGNIIAWYENDGNENFSAHTITTGANGGEGVYAEDVDGDGDMDVLSASVFDNKIAWYENDGNENFTPYTITNSAFGARTVYAVDVDGDGDMDVLSASTSDDKIAWYENDGNENFTPHTITTSADEAWSVYAEDVDDDGDMDVLSASNFDDKIAWYENDGNENFTPHTITTSADWANSVYAVDVDGDGDMDVLSASFLDDKIAWYENDGNENFTPHTIITGGIGALSVYAVDIDGDGDIDVISNRVAWYENDGNENFTTHTITTGAIGARSVYAVDVDGDGNMDVLSAFGGGVDDKIAWYENNLPTMINVPGDVPTIQAGIDSASIGDFVLVDDGTYYENINFKGKAITVASHFLLYGDSTHIDSTIIDGSQPSHPDSGSVVLFSSGEDTSSAIIGFTISNGTGTVYGSQAYRGGGGIFCLNSGVRIEFNKIINNSVNHSNEAMGGGIGVDAQSSTNVVIRENQIIGNSVTGVNGAFGGGVEVLYSNGEIFKNIISNNSCVSSANQANSGGLGFWTDSPDTPFVVIKENEIIGNTAIGVDVGQFSGAGSGGLGIYRYYASIEKNTIAQNVVNGSEDAYGAGLSCGDIHDNLVIDGNYIAHNVIEHGRGWGGGLCIYRASATVINNIIVNNSAADGSVSYGGGIWIRDNSTVDVLNNAILFNVANEGGGINSQNSNTTIMNTILWGDSSTSGHHELQSSGGSLNVVYSDIEGSTIWPGEGNISKEPMLRGENYELSDSSNCIGAGTLSYQFGSTTITCPSTCYLGRARPSPSGSNPDMGACESLLGSQVVGLDRQLSINIPKSYDLKQNYPNPFNPSTTIEFDLPKTSQVTLNIFNILGEEVATLVSDRLSTGSYSYEWDASGYASGIYLYRLQAGEYVETRKMVLMR